MGKFKTVKKKAVNTVRIAKRDKNGEIERDAAGRPQFRDVQPGENFDCPVDDVKFFTESNAITAPGKDKTAAEKAADIPPPEGDNDDDDLEAMGKDELVALAKELKINGASKSWGEDTLRAKILDARAEEPDSVL